MGRIIRLSYLIFFVFFATTSLAVPGAVWEAHQTSLVDSVARGDKLYKHVFVQLKKLRKALREEELLQHVRFTLLEQQIKDFNVNGAIEILKEYQSQGSRAVKRLVRKILRKLKNFVSTPSAPPPALAGISWSPVAAGVVGTDLVLEGVQGVQNGDNVSYMFVRGNCHFGTGSEEALRTLIFSDAGTCVFRAIVSRRGHASWDSGEKSIEVELGTLENISWSPTTAGEVGVDLALEEVSGIENGDVVSYMRVSGHCNIVGGATITFSDAGTCVVRAGVERKGYHPWESQDKSITVERGRLVAIGWTPAIGGTVGSDLILAPVDGIRNGDTVIYTKVSGACHFGSGDGTAERTLSFTQEGICVVRARVERRGYYSWDSSDRNHCGRRGQFVKRQLESCRGRSCRIRSCFGGSGWNPKWGCRGLYQGQRKL